MPIDDATVGLVRESLTVALKICAPVLAAGILIGLTISILQSITQIQEQTLTIVPKIFAMGTVAIALMPWIASRLVDFASWMFMLS